MAVRAVVFDIGGVLEICEPAEAWLAPWRSRLQMDPTAFDALLGSVDPIDQIGVGKMTETDWRNRSRDALGLTEKQADQFLADMWDWYCGVPDRELAAYIARLRPAYITGILSNSADGARREKQARYGFEQLVDTIIYSHEVGLAKPDPAIYALACETFGVAPHEMVFVDDVPANVSAAREFGILGVLHTSTPGTIATITTITAVAAHK